MLTQQGEPMERPLLLEDLNQGDILVFKGDNSDWISKAIMVLTNSDVSHAALYYGRSLIADEGLVGMKTHVVEDCPDGYQIYVRRLADNTLSMKPVVDAASAYLLEDNPYSMPNLVLLGLLLLYKKFVPTSLQEELVTAFLRKVTAELADFINGHLYPGKHPMICSQFVFQCYEDAPDPYHLIVRKGNLQAAADKARGADTLLRHIIAGVENEKIRPAAIAPGPVRLGYDEILEKLIPELESEPTTGGERVNQPAIGAELTDAASRFCAVLVSPWTSADSYDAMVLVAGQQALFVTPADLKAKCVNVTDTGMVCLSRR